MQRTLGKLTEAELIKKLSDLIHYVRTPHNRNRIMCALIDELEFRLIPDPDADIPSSDELQYLIPN